MHQLFAWPRFVNVRCKTQMQILTVIKKGIRYTLTFRVIYFIDDLTILLPFWRRHARKVIWHISLWMWPPAYALIAANLFYCCSHWSVCMTLYGGIIQDIWQAIWKLLLTPSTKIRTWVGFGSNLDATHEVISISFQQSHCNVLVNLFLLHYWFNQVT